MYEFPAHLSRGPVSFPSHHFPPAVADDPEELAVRHLFNRRGITPVMKLQFHILGKVAFTASILAVAHGTVIRVLLACFRQSFWRGRNGVFLCGILGRHLGFRGARFFLSEIWLGAENSTEQHCTRNEDRPTHSILPTGRAPPKERTRLDFERILRPHDVEGKGLS